MPYQVANNLALTNQCLGFHWPSPSELNKEVTSFWWENDDKYWRYINGDYIIMLPILATGPPPATPTHPVPMVPSIPQLVAAIVQSTDRLFLSLTKLGITMLRNGAWRGWPSWIPCRFILCARLTVGSSSNFTFATQLIGAIMRWTNDIGIRFIVLTISRLPMKWLTLTWFVQLRHPRATHLPTNCCI